MFNIDKLRGDDNEIQRWSNLIFLSRRFAQINCPQRHTVPQQNNLHFDNTIFCVSNLKTVDKIWPGSRRKVLHACG